MEWKILAVDWGGKDFPNVLWWNLPTITGNITIFVLGRFLFYVVLYIFYLDLPLMNQYIQDYWNGILRRVYGGNTSRSVLLIVDK